ALHYEMLACYEREDLPGYYEFNAKIHNAINAAAHNPVLASTYHSINARVQSLRYRTNQDAAKWKHAIQEHEQMMQALSERDSAGMRAILLEHLQRKRDLVLELLHAGKLYPGAPAPHGETRRSA